MTRDKNQFDVIVVGAGLIGAAFALSLAKQSGLSIAVVERGQAVDGEGVPNQRVSALGKVAVDLLKELSVWKQLPDSAFHSYQSMFVWDEHSAGALRFNASDYQYAELGYIVDNIQCLQVLQSELAKQANVTLYYGMNCNSIDQTDGEVTVSGHINGSEAIRLSSELLVAADGQQSWVRRQLQIKVKRFDYQQLGIVATFKTKRSHENTAWQCFLETGPVAALPLANGESSLVWSAEKVLAQQLLNLDDEAFNKALDDIFGVYLGRVSHISRRRAFPLHSIKASEYCRDNIILVGDAAHNIHPLAGQGANLGFKDVTALLTCLLDSQSKGSHLLNKAMLRSYERQRKLDNETTDYMMTVLHNVFKPMPNWATWSRGSAMLTINNSHRLKGQLVKQAVGRL